MENKKAFARHILRSGEEIIDSLQYSPSMRQFMMEEYKREKNLYSFLPSTQVASAIIHRYKTHLENSSKNQENTKTQSSVKLSAERKADENDNSDVEYGENMLPGIFHLTPSGSLLKHQKTLLTRFVADYESHRILDYKKEYLKKSQSVRPKRLQMFPDSNTPSTPVTDTKNILKVTRSKVNNNDCVAPVNNLERKTDVVINVQAQYTKTDVSENPVRCIRKKACVTVFMYSPIIQNLQQLKFGRSGSHEERLDKPESVPEKPPSLSSTNPLSPGPSSSVPSLLSPDNTKLDDDLQSMKESHSPRELSPDMFQTSSEEDLTDDDNDETNLSNMKKGTEDLPEVTSSEISGIASCDMVRTLIQFTNI